MIVIGRGEREPIASNDTASGWAQNRRVEILLSGPTARG
jgi:outer membrane protein OmpA-like peptidoglycan-associated protein